MTRRQRKAFIRDARERGRKVAADVPRITPVIFRVWPKSEGGGVFALFPADPGTHEPHTCDSYEHVGQHASADLYGCIARTRAATPVEYETLKRELESIGYVLRIYKRATRGLCEQRHAELRAS